MNKKFILLSLIVLYAHQLLSSQSDELPLINRSEITATRQDARFWIENMLHYHNFRLDEASHVFGWTKDQLSEEMKRLGITQEKPAIRRTPIVLLPYPGGRHPRIGFLDGAINPIRSSKASVFLPDAPESYIVIDLPEAIWCNGELIYLAHTHIPTMWDRQHKEIENNDWARHPDGSLENSWMLPNGVQFGSKIYTDDKVYMELWLKNDSKETLTGLLVQVCVMLKSAEGFNALSKDNKTYEGATATVKSSDGRAISTTWEQCDRAWGNEDVPCLHSDPKFPDCSPGETVRLKGVLQFMNMDN